MSKVSNPKIKIEYCTQQAEIYLEYCLMYPKIITSKLSSVYNIEAFGIHSKCHSKSQKFKKLDKIKIL